MMQTMFFRVLANGWMRARRVGDVALAAVLVLAQTFSPHVLAQLPTVANPSRGVTAGDYLRLMQDYLFDFALVVGLALAAFALFKVAAGALLIYHQVQEGKARWGDLGMHLGVGAGLLLVIVFLVTQASGVL